MISKKIALASWVVLGMLIGTIKMADAAYPRHRSHHGHNHHLHSTRLSNISATFYADDGISANGYTYRQNDRRFGYCVACNMCRLGDVLQLPSRCGGFIRAVNVDGIGHGSDLDMHRRTAHMVMGNLDRGRMMLTARVVGHVDCMAHRHHRHHRHHRR